VLVVLTTAVAALAIVPAAMAAAPANDDFANAEVVTGSTGTTTGTNVEATDETGEPANHFTDDLGGASVWYAWTAPSSGLFAFDTFGSDVTLDTVLGVYTGSLGSLTEIGYNDDYGGACCDSRVVFAATSGTTYYVGVSGCCGTPAQRGPFTLNWDSATRPSNDAFASAVPISGATGTQPGNNFDATGEAGEAANHYTPDLGADSTWYTWTAPSTQVFIFTASGTNYRGSPIGLNVGVYTGSLGSLTEEAFGNNGSGGAFAATSGTTYTIGVGGCCGASGETMGGMGDFTLSWETDTVEPTTSIVSTGKGKHSVTFSFTGSDDHTSPANLDFECKLDNGAFAPCTSPTTFSSVTGGAHTVAVRAVDESGNTDSTPATATIRASGSPKTTT
jgi:hypothetical protein